MALEVKVHVDVMDTLDGERIYSCRRAETVVPARMLTGHPDPDAVVPLLEAVVARLCDEGRDHVKNQLQQGSDMVKEQFGE